MKRILMAAALFCCMTTMALLTSCTEVEPIEYGKVFDYTYQGQTLYYIVDSAGEASVVPPLYPYLDYKTDESWTGYDKPQGDVVIPDHVPYCGKDYPVKRILFCAFFKCYDITNVSLPSTLTFIDKHSFLLCTSLTSIEVPEGVTDICFGAFDTCESVTSISLPSTLKYIGEWCFLSCLKVSELVLPNSLEYLGDNCFTDMEALVSINLPESLKSMGVGIFDNCFNLTEVTIPTAIKEVPGWAFSNCLSLTKVNLHDGITSIGEGAFNNMPYIKSITLPASLKTIGKDAFHYDASLGPNIDIPAEVTSIADDAFAECYGIQTITLACTTPPAILVNTFPGFDITVIVPKGSGDAYRNHEIWGRFATIQEKE